MTIHHQRKNSPSKEGAGRNDRLIVVPYRPQRKLWMLLISVLGYSFVALGSYYGAQLIVQAPVGGASASNSVMSGQSSQVKQLREEVGQLREQIAIYRQNGEVERQAIEMVRRENKQLLEEISTLNEKVAYYKRVVKPDHQDKGLVIGKFLVKPTTQKNRFRYNFNLIQVSGSGRVGGKVFVKLLGVDKGQKAKISLKELSSTVDSNSIKIGFRNFQAFEGELVISEEFQPEQVEIVAQFNTGKSVRLRKVYDWVVEETLADVGQG